MKQVFCIFLLTAFTLHGFGQISPELKTGLGYVYVIDKDESKKPDFHTLKGYPTISVEKPFPIEVRLKKRLSLNPGISYYYFKEKKLLGNTIKGEDFNLNHQSLNGFVKVLYQAKLAGKTEAFVYAGGIGGFNFLTKTKGTKYIYGLNVEIPEYDSKVNEHGRDFFELFYYGAVAGFQPNAGKYNFIKPSFELAFYPGFISKTKEVEQLAFQHINTVQFTVLLGFRIK